MLIEQPYIELRRPWDLSQVRGERLRVGRAPEGTGGAVLPSAYAKVLARIKNYRRMAIWMAKWRYGGRGAQGERSESQSKQGVRGQRPRAILFLSIRKQTQFTSPQT